jgi:hypothetical protein
MSNIETAKDLGKGIYTKQEVDTNITNDVKGTFLNRMYEYDTTTRSFGDSWSLGKTFSNFTKQPGSDVMLYWRVPMRNDADGWGGGYTRIEYSLDGGTTYRSLGETGYDGGVMIYQGRGIGSNSGSWLLDLDTIRNATQIRIRFQHRSYDGNVTVNGYHSIVTGDLGLFWTNITLLEIGA